MQEFRIKDKNTGMEVLVKGNAPPPVEALPQIFANTKRMAAESLSDGSFKMNKETFQPYSKQEQRDLVRKLSSQAIGVSPDDVDVDSGMGLGGRFQLDQLPDDASKFEFLQKKYGDDNVDMLNIGGKPKMFYRDPKTKKMTMVDEMGTSLADFTADISSEAITTAGAIGGAIVGTALTPFTGGVINPVIGAAGGAAVGGFLTGVTQDVVAEAATGQDIELGQKVKRRGVEAAIGIPIDLMTGGVARVLGRSFAKRKGLEVIDDLIRSTDELNTAYNTNIKLTAAQSSNPDASIQQSMRAGLDPKGREANFYNDQLDEIGRIQNTIKTGKASDEPIESVMMRMGEKHLQKLERYRAQVDKLDDIKIREEAVAKKQGESFIRNKKAELQKQRDLEHQARLDKYGSSFEKMRKNVEKLEKIRGREVRGQIERKYSEALQNNNNLYEEAYRLTDTQQANTPVSAVSRSISRIDEDQFISDSPELMALRALKKRIAEDSSDLTFRELDSFVRQFGDRVNFKKKHGLKFNELSFRSAYGQLNKLWDDAVGAPKKLGGRGAGEPARKAHMAARQDFRKNVLPYTEDEPAAILAKKAGGMSGTKLADEDVLLQTLSSSQSVKNALKAGAERQTLKDAYLNQVLQAAEGGKPVRFDRNILDELYSTTKSRKAGERGRGAQVEANLRNLNKMLQDSKIKPDSVKLDDIREYVEAFDPPARAKAAKAIKLRDKAKAKLDAANKDVLMKVMRGEQPAPADIYEFVDDIAKLRPEQINRIKGRLSPSEQKSLERSGIDWLLEKAGAADEGVQRTSAQTGGMALWNPDAMHKLLANSKQRAKLESLLGKDVVADYARMNKVLGNAAILRSTSEGAGSRVVLTTGASGVPTPLIVSPGIPRWLGRKMLGVIHTSPLGKWMLRGWLQEPDKKAAEQLFQKIFFTSIGTRAGMAAAADEGNKDPRFSAWLQESYADRIQER